MSKRRTQLRRGALYTALQFLAEQDFSTTRQPTIQRDQPQSFVSVDEMLSRSSSVTTQSHSADTVVDAVMAGIVDDTIYRLILLSGIL